MSHIPVLLKETIQLLNLKKGDVVVDATLGAGGHGREILKKIGEKGRMIGIDLDINAINAFEENYSLQTTNYSLANDNFANIESILRNLGIDKVDAVLADLGWRIEQIEDPAYGMSFKNDAPLDMRLSKIKSQKSKVKIEKSLAGVVSAKDIINEWREVELARIFRDYGQERFAKQVAGAIVAARKDGEIKTTGQLVRIIERSIGFKYKKSKINPATKVFQALRIEVNQELENLKKFLDASLGILRPGARMAIISFHSLEDRMVKEFFRSNARGCVCPIEFPKCVCGNKPKLKLVTKKAIKSSQSEMESNPRSRSARLRIAELV